MKNRDIGLILIAISVVFAVLVWLFRSSLDKLETGTCSNEAVCPMSSAIVLQTNIGAVFILCIILLGLYIMFFAKEESQLLQQVQKEIKTMNKKPKKKYSVILKDLNSEEKIIVKELLNNNGSLFQSQLVSITGHSKVKVTRILDRLESKDVIERKRRGMTNLVLLKK